MSTIIVIESTSPRSPRSSDGAKEDVPVLLPSPAGFSTSALRRMRLENERLQAEITRLRRLVVSGASSVLAERQKVSDDDVNNPSRLQALEMELQLAREAISGNVVI